MAAKFPETFSAQSGEEEDQWPELTANGFGAKEGQNRREILCANVLIAHPPSSIRACAWRSFFVR
jgi:hypothetical protein